MNPNLTQVGGSHYRAPFQHWDLVAKLRLGYYEGQITRYITRHAKKNGAQDLDKALHYLLKLMHLHEHSAWAPQHGFASFGVMHDYGTGNNLGAEEVKLVSDVCGWLTLNDLKLIEVALTKLRLQRYPTGLPLPVPQDGDMFRARLIDDDGSSPGPGYVDQG